MQAMNHPPRVAAEQGGEEGGQPTQRGKWNVSSTVPALAELIIFYSGETDDE